MADPSPPAGPSTSAIDPALTTAPTAPIEASAALPDPDPFPQASDFPAPPVQTQREEVGEGQGVTDPMVLDPALASVVAEAELGSVEAKGEGEVEERPRAEGASAAPEASSSTGSPALGSTSLSRTASQKGKGKALASEASATPPIKKKPHPNQHTKRREAEAAALAAALAAGLPPPPPMKRAPQPNQYTKKHLLKGGKKSKPATAPSAAAAAPKPKPVPVYPLPLKTVVKTLPNGETVVIQRRPQPNQHTKRREAEAAAAAAAAAAGLPPPPTASTSAAPKKKVIVKKKIVHQAPAPSSDGKKKPHANQWTYMRKDDPNRPKGANQYTVKRRLEALAAAAKAEAAAGGSGAAAAAYQAELYKTTNKGAYVRAAVEAAQREFSEEFGSSPTSTPVAKPKVYKASHKGKERDAGSGALTAERLARQQAGEGGGEVATKKKKKKKEEDAKSTVSEDDRIYCICRQLYDPERMMIACDRCDNWYHNDCVGINEDDVDLVDQFICPPCEIESGDRRTTWKPRCARPGCNAPAVPLSKYCTDWCGITVAATRLELADKLLPIEAFWQRVDGARKRDGAAVVEPFVGAVVNGTAVQDATDVEMSQLAATLKDDLDRLETKRNGVENTLSLVLSRLEFLRFAVDRWEAMCVATARALAQQAEAGGVEGSPARKGAAKGKGKRPSGAGAGTSSAEAPCGFDVRLVWDDRDWEAWANSDEGRSILVEGVGFAGGAEELTRAAEEGVVCLMMKKRCDRHSGWQKTREADFEAERASVTKRLDRLCDQERSLRQQIEEHEAVARFRSQGFHRPAPGTTVRVINAPKPPAPGGKKRKGQKGGAAAAAAAAGLASGGNTPVVANGFGSPSPAASATPALAPGPLPAVEEAIKEPVVNGEAHQAVNGFVEDVSVDMTPVDVPADVVPSVEVVPEVIEAKPDPVEAEVEDAMEVDVVMAPTVTIEAH